MKKKDATGLTLIELLIVLLMIGVLAAIALPTYFKHIKKSRTAEAISNLNTIASLEQAYYNDARHYLCLEANPTVVPKGGEKGAFDPKLDNWEALGQVLPKGTRTYFQYRAFAGRFDIINPTGGGSPPLVDDLTCMSTNGYDTKFPIERAMTADSDCAGAVSAEDLEIPPESRADFYWLTAIADQDGDGKCSVFIKVKDRADIYRRDELE